MMNRAPALKIEKLKKTYSDGLLALDGVTLEVEAGRFFGLLGPNGAGKTTLINSVVSLARPDSGTVEVFGRDAYREFREARRMIGVSPQEINLDKFLTVEETMLYHAGYYGVPKQKAKERTEELLERFALTEKRRQRVNTLSGGMKRRVLFARALMHDPRLLFLDEPTAGVDVELRRDMWQMVRSLRESGVTIILTTHYIGEAEEMADRIGVISNGEIILIEDKVELMRKLGKKRLTLQLQSKLDWIPSELEEYGLELTADGRELIYTYDTQIERTSITSLLADLNENGVKFKDLQTEQSSLEDIFVSLVKERR